MSNTELSSPPLPLLVEGDRLTAAEFERRYHAMPELKKAELIEGVVRMPSPVSAVNHGIPHTVVGIWAGTRPVAPTRLAISCWVSLSSMISLPSSLTASSSSIRATRP